MVPLDYALAIAVLTTSPPVGPSSSGPEALPEHRCLMRSIRLVAERLEVLDRRERSYFLAHAKDFAADVDLLRKRWRDLASAPPIGDCAHFPGKCVAQELLAFNRAHHQYLRMRRDGEGPRAKHLDEALVEVERLYKLWDLLRDAASDCYYVTVRRQALADLRQALGEEVYFRADMPPAVPIWRFAARD
jgi:hypothetical protein